MHEIMEFVLPVLFASGEAMIWVLLFALLIAIGRGRLLPSEKTLVIERQSRYSMVLAPGLNLALPFVEALAEHLHKDAARDGLPLCFEVTDPQVSPRTPYLLRISERAELLHFETCAAPQRLTDADGDSAGEIEDAVRKIGTSWTVRLRRIAQPETHVKANPT